MTIPVTSQPVFPSDVSLTLNGSAQKLVGKNLNRTHLQMQAPVAGGNVSYSYTNGSNTAAPGTPQAGTYILTTGATYSPTFGLPGSEVWVNGTSGQILIATEC